MTETDLMQRLETLERDNRRFKRLALVALVLPIALVSIYATRPVPDIIKAHEFQVVDSAGVVQATLSMVSVVPPSLVKRWKSLTGITAGPHAALTMRGSFEQNGEKVSTRVDLAPSDLMMLAASDRESDITDLTEGGLILMGPSPSVSLTDAKGFTMNLGSTDAVAEKTGATQQTSADSIVMFGNGKKHHVIWQAP